MKKILLLLILVSTISIKAQTFDETQLSGTWKVEKIVGTLPMRIVSFDKLLFGRICNSPAASIRICNPIILFQLIFVTPWDNRI